MNLKKLLFIGLLFASITIFNSCKDDDDATSADTEKIVVVANRGSSDITFIDSETNTILETLSIPNSEPMYVVYVAQTDKVYVGDRAQSVVHVIDAKTREVMTQIPVGQGVFHMWANSQGTSLWVNGDIDNTTTVIDLTDNTVVQTIDLGEKPHDVFITEDGTKAFISILKGDITVPDEIFMYNATTYEFMDTRVVGDDPHLFYLPNLNKLFVPCQSGGVFVFDENFTETTNIAIDGSHGIFTRDNQNIYIADLPGAELYTVDATTNQVIGSPLATTENIPHNITVNADNSKLFLTHSGGTADKLTIYDITDTGISLNETVTIGTNPFGIAYYSRQD